MEIGILEGRKHLPHILADDFLIRFAADFLGLFVEERVAELVVHGEKDFRNTAENVLTLLQAVANILVEGAAAQESFDLKNQKARVEGIGQQGGVSVFSQIDCGEIGFGRATDDEGGIESGLGWRVGEGFEAALEGAPCGWGKDEQVACPKHRKIRVFETETFDDSVILFLEAMGDLASALQIGEKKANP
jgi:hypothetical protein